MKITKLISKIGLAALLIVSSVSTALATDSTVVVKPGDLATSFADVISNPTKWLYYNDENDTIDNTLGSYVVGPETAPIGQDSVAISVSGTQRRNLATYGFSGTPLASITKLAFSTYNPSVGNGGSINRSGYLQFNVDFNGTDTWQRRLVYVPSVNGTVTQNTWQEWDAATSSSLWSYSGATWPAPGATLPGTTAKTWATILSEYPGIRVRVTDSFMGVRVGEPYADGYTENIDAFKFGTSAGITTFDFDVVEEDVTAPSAPAHTLPLDNSVITTHDFTFDWSDVTDLSAPVTYDWEASLSSTINPDGSFTAVLASHTGLTDSSVYSPGTPDGAYYWHVRSADNAGNKSAWTGAWKVTVTTAPVLVAPPTNKDQCKHNGWKTFNNPPFSNQGQCEKYVKDHKKDGKAEGELRLGGPNQRINFEVKENESGDDDHDRRHHDDRDELGKVEYWNYEYPGGLHYKTQALCVNVDKVTKEARFMFQIPSGHPGLSGLYVVAYTKDVLPKGATDLYGHAATADLATATSWCETGVGFSPAMYSVTKGKVEVK